MCHGGRGNSSDFREVKGNKSGSMEYGPGLYLTNYYETAQKYSKGGGKIQKITFSRGTDISTVVVEKAKVVKFITDTRMTNKKLLLADIQRYGETVKLEYVINLMINHDCLTPGVSATVRQFVIDCGADYALHKGYAGWNDQHIAVIFNPKVIKKVEIVSPKDTIEWVLPAP